MEHRLQRQCRRNLSILLPFRTLGLQQIGAARVRGSSSGRWCMTAVPLSPEVLAFAAIATAIQPLREIQRSALPGSCEGQAPDVSAGAHYSMDVQ
jgi:hypothetical protein